MAKSSEYWQKRFTAIEAQNNKTARSTVHSVTTAFDKAQAQIEKELNAWYARFADDNQITLQEAKRLLTTRELKEFRWDVEKYIEMGQQNALDQKWLKELENASAKVHISRLEALRIRTQQAAELAFGNELDALDQMAARMYTDDYYHTAYEIQRGLGIGWDIGQIDQRRLDNVLSKPWTADKLTFSDRLWKSKTQLLDSLQTEFTQMCILGKAPDETIKLISHKMNVSKGQAGRLIMTEAAYFSSAAQKDCFNDLDVEKFEVVATLDRRTSETCQHMDGQVFDMKDFQIGVTAPPFHVWCRTCTAPWFEDNDDGTRAARGEDGQTYQVPASMKYDDWKQTFVNGGSKNGLNPIDNVDDLRKQLAEKQVEFDYLKKQIDSKKLEQDEFLTGWNDPAYQKFKGMSDDEYQKYLDDLKQQEQSFTSEYDQIQKEYNRYFDRPDRRSPERAEWDAWHEEIKSKYGIDNASELFNNLTDIQNKRSAVRDQLNDSFGFSHWKSKFSGKTEQDYADDLANLTSAQQAVQAKINSLNNQLQQAIQAQAQSAYSAKHLNQIRDDIIKRHEAILKTDIQKREFATIIDGMSKEQANLYERMSVNFQSNAYYDKGTGYYSPAKRRVEMDLDALDWEKAVGRTDHGAWKVKWHEELHQMDDILGQYQKSKFAQTVNDPTKFTPKFTNTGSVTGSKMIKAIDEDVMNLINQAVDWDVATNGVSVKHIKDLSRISSDAKDALIRYLQTNYPSRKDKALISGVTDAIGLTTKGNLHPYKHGFWGHNEKYCKSRWKDGATSEVWAELGAGLMRNDQEMIDNFTKLMPNTVKVFSDTLDEVMDWAKTGSFDYTKP